MHTGQILLPLAFVVVRDSCDDDENLAVVMASKQEIIKQKQNNAADLEWHTPT